MGRKEMVAKHAQMVSGSGGCEVYERLQTENTHGTSGSTIRTTKGPDVTTYNPREREIKRQRAVIPLDEQWPTAIRDDNRRRRSRSTKRHANVKTTCESTPRPFEGKVSQTRVQSMQTTHRPPRTVSAVPASEFDCYRPQS